MSNKKEKNFGGPMSVTFKNIQLAYNRSFKSAGLNITADQWRILNLLHADDGVPQISLCEGSLKNAGTVSRIIDLLCQKKLTKRKRSAEDKRVFNVHLTSKGKLTIEKALPLVQELRSRGWKGLTNKDYSSFMKILNKLSENFEQMH